MYNGEWNVKRKTVMKNKYVNFYFSIAQFSIHKSNATIVGLVGRN